MYNFGKCFDCCKFCVNEWFFNILEWIDINRFCICVFFDCFLIVWMVFFNGIVVVISIESWCVNKVKL